MDSVGVELPLHQSARAFSLLLFFFLFWLHSSHCGGFIDGEKADIYSGVCRVPLQIRKRPTNVYSMHVYIIILLFLLSAECAPTYTRYLSHLRRPISASHWLFTNYRLCHTVSASPIFYIGSGAPISARGGYWFDDCVRQTFFKSISGQI